jgi:hypothetical protein
MSQPDVLFQPQITSQLPSTPEEQRAVELIQALGEQRVLWLQDPDHPERSAFVAASPAIALQWICQKAQKKNVLEYVRKRARTPDSSAGESSSPKRARVKTTNRTKEHLTKTVDDAKVYYRSIWHNSQEAEDHARKDDAFTRERARWLQYVGKQPEAQGAGAGVAEAIKRAVAVGNSEAVRDLQLMLRHWRSRYAWTPSSSQARLAEGATPSTSTSMMALRDGSPKHRARYHYLRYETAEQLGAGLAVARRYHAARLRQNYEDRLAREVQPERDPPISRKRRVEIQAELYLDVKPRGAAVRGDAGFDAFQRTLKHGKRWRALEGRFGAGIFALLPKSRVPSTFIERTLTDELFRLWMRMLQACSPLVVQMAREISWLVVLYADDHAPPPQRLYLENDDDGDLGDTEGPTEMLALLLERVGAHSRVEEVSPSREGTEPASDLQDRTLFTAQAEGRDEEIGDPGRGLFVTQAGTEEEADAAVELEEDYQDLDFGDNTLSDDEVYNTS